LKSNGIAALTLALPMCMITVVAKGQICNKTFTPPSSGSTIEILSEGANCNINDTSQTPCDDTAVFQAALSYLKKNAGGVINLPSGKTCAANIEIDSSAAGPSVCIVGRGRRSSFLTPL